MKVISTITNPVHVGAKRSIRIVAKENGLPEMSQCRMYIRGIFWKYTHIIDARIYPDEPTIIRYKLYDLPAKLGMHQPVEGPREYLFEFVNSPDDLTGFECDDKEAFNLMEASEV